MEIIDSVALVERSVRARVGGRAPGKVGQGRSEGRLERRG